MINIINEIKYLKNYENLSVNFKNHNKFRLLINEINGISAWYSSIPLYRDKDGSLLNDFWELNEDCSVFRGINAEIKIKDNMIELWNKTAKIRLLFNDEIEIESTYNGVAISYLGESISFIVETDYSYQMRNNHSCVAFMIEQYTPIFVINGFVGKGAESIFPVEIDDKILSSVRHKITVTSYGAEQIIFEMDMHVPKFIFDTTVESKNPDMNNAFGSVAFLGNSDFYGEQWLYTRFDVMELIDLNSYHVDKAFFYLPKFADTTNMLEKIKLNTPWCSFGTTWNNKANYSLLHQNIKKNMKYEIVEVTDVIKDILSLNEPRNPGIVIKGKYSSGYSVVSTGDNYLLPQLLEIKLIK